ncbi:MAG: hypothetical protein AB1589_31400 [Cyanobacteriota bacterium]
MKATVRDLDILKAIQPDQVATYLQEKGWHEKRQIAEHASIWSLKSDSGEEFQIVLPLNSEIPGFPVSMNIVLETLEIAEGRSQLEILDDLISCVPNIQVQGIVTTLNKGSQTSQVTLMGCAVGKFCKIYVELTDAEYSLAVKAYQERSPVVCTGDLIRQDKTFILKNPHHFS